MTENCEFKYGDEVEVRDNRNSPWQKRIFIFYDMDGEYQYIARTENGPSVSWKYCQRCRPDLKIDDPVIVWNYGENEHRRHFAGWEDGHIVAYKNGFTSFTAPKMCRRIYNVSASWDHYRIPTDEEINGG